MFKDIVGTLWKSDKAEDAPAKTAAFAPVTTPGTVPVPPAAPVASVLDVEHVTAGIDTLIQQSPAYAPFASFASAMNDIRELIKDEPLRFKTAQATTKAPIPELIASARSYANVLVQQGEDFQKNFIAAAEQEIKNAEDTIPVLDQQIQELTQKLGDLSQQKSDLTASVILKRGNLEKAKVDFKSILSTLDAKYAEIATKVSNYLGA